MINHQTLAKVLHLQNLVLAMGKTKGGEIVRFEPQDPSLINSDLATRETFEEVGCVRFFEKMQGYNVELTKEFALNFDGDEVKVGKLKFIVS